MKVNQRSSEVRRRGARLWLRLLLLCMLFSASHVTLGAWVVTSVADGQPVVQLCTPQGVQWVVLDAGVTEQDRETADESMAPCVWASAHVAAAPPLSAGLKLVAQNRQVADLAPIEEGQPSGRVQRVLLMSAMRGPPTAMRYAI
jgi:hypothetical protein